MRIFSYIIILVLVVMGISFATLNSQSVSINYYVGHRVMPLSLLVVTIFSTGCLMGALVGLWFVVKAKLKSHRLKQRLKLAEKEIENLRAIPLQDKH